MVFDSRELKTISDGPDKWLVTDRQDLERFDISDVLASEDRCFNTLPEAMAEAKRGSVFAQTYFIWGYPHPIASRPVTAVAIAGELYVPLEDSRFEGSTTNAHH